MRGFKIEIDGFDETIRNLGEFQKELPSCISRALNRSLEMTKTEMLRKTMEKYTIRRNKLDNTVNLFKSTKSNLNGSIYSSGKRIGLNHFKLTPQKHLYRKGVKVAVRKGPLKSITSEKAFIAFKDGFLGAFVRTGKIGITKSRRTGKKRKQSTIRRLRSLSAPQMLGELSILEYLQRYADDKFRIRLDHEIDRVIGI